MGLLEDMRRIDDSTLEMIAELICGSGAGTGGGYSSPGPYRTMGEIHDFFRRAGVRPQGQSSTRKWFVLESVQSINGTKDLDEVLMRLASPKEYRGDSNLTQEVVGYLNRALQVEGLEVYLVGVDPKLRERKASANPTKSQTPSLDIPPDFPSLVGDSSLAEILTQRWHEAQKCVNAEAYLAAVVMMGSILEGALLHKVEVNPAAANRAKASPKDRKTGKPSPFHNWGLSTLIDVAHELGWLQGDVSRFSHALRESRNMVHPYMERVLPDRPDRDTCSICWQVVRAAVSDLLEIDRVR